MFGVTTNSFWKNLGWAKKGILSFSYVPLTMLTTAALFLFGVSVVLIVAEAVLKLVAPNLTPRGITTVLLSILFFGSLNLLAIGVVGEYLAKIFEEVKQRPHFIRRSVIRDGEIRLTAQEQKRRQ